MLAFLLLPLLLREIDRCQPSIEFINLLFLSLGLGLGLLFQELVTHLSVHLHALVFVDRCALEPLRFRCLLLGAFVNRHELSMQVLFVPGLRLLFEFAQLSLAFLLLLLYQKVALGLQSRATLLDRLSRRLGLSEGSLCLLALLPH